MQNRAMIAGSITLDQLFSLLEEAGELLIVCATNRLARNLHLSFGQGQLQKGASVWPTPTANTVDNWLNSLGEQISLLGEAPVEMIPERVLSPFQAGLVWKQSIAASVGDATPLELFNLHSLAKTAFDAHVLLNTWDIHLADESGSEETQQFIAWRKRYDDICRKNKWMDATEYHQQILGWLERGAGTLPARVVFAGFDRLTPFLQRLNAVLVARGVQVAHLDFSAAPASVMRAVSCKDVEAECRVAAVWAKQMLDDKPDACIGIVVSDLEARREVIVPVLDEVLNPAILLGAEDNAPRRHNISLGTPLSRYGLVRTALALLRLLAQPQYIPSTAFGDLLRMAYWSADQSEADLRAMLDAGLRERGGQNLTVAAVLRLANSLSNSAELTLPKHLQALLEAQSNCIQLRTPGAWAKFFHATLGQVGWPGERTLASDEFQTRAAFNEVMAAFAELDAFMGNTSIQTALGELTRLCNEKIFQPKTLGQPPVQVLGMLEAAGAAFDALWVMGMNDQHWPPPARPNPLLPAAVQRQHRTPGASPEVQMAFARTIHRHLLHSSPDITFSYAEKEGERELRPSALIADLTGRAVHCEPSLATGMFAHGQNKNITTAYEYLDDHQAPPLAAGEKVSGGSSLLKAQAICPAWAFYRYRLGAKKLAMPIEGLDASSRGTLVHAMLEAFWSAVNNSEKLLSLAPEQLNGEIAAAVEVALRKFEADMGEPFTPTLRRLEAKRLHQLGLEWLMVELEQGRAAFKVIACEKKHALDLGALRINLAIDRVDELDDGRLVVLDYKTGNTVDMQGWFGDRLIEPQVPLYAAIVLAQSGHPPIAAVAFAHVRLTKCEFVGVEACKGLLPGVQLKLKRDSVFQDGSIGVSVIPAQAGLLDSRLRGNDDIDEWQAMLNDWQEKLMAIAEEIRSGHAAVCYTDAQDLAYCEVLPLLRLAERKLQFEKTQERLQ